MIKPNSYIVIQGWMVSDLKLSGTELLIYAIIYGFSQDGDSCFEGKPTYLEEWTNASHSTVYRALASLINKGLITKTERSYGFIEYRTTSCFESVEAPQSESFGESVMELTQGDLDRITDAWNASAVTLNITGIKPFTKRYDDVRLLLRFYTVNEICDTFKNLDSQGWFKQRINKGNPITFDWAIRDFQKIVEGNYSKKFLAKGEIDWENV